MASGRFVELIRKKQSGLPLKVEEINWMVKEYVSGEIPDYQMSAMLMIIRYTGMNDIELTTLTTAMRDSGSVMDLSEINGIKVDKHSTGGVGDKTTLIVAPIVAACGVPVAKMSGRGLGFTGGTIDKLESIPGFRTDLSKDEFFKTVNEIGVSVIGQSEELAPADKKMYALRDVTGTVDSIPLIAASIMSKKLASGSDKIVLDVTTGSGAFIKKMEDSVELAKRMVSIGNGAGKETLALITNMDEPLGYAIGNQLEVIEALDTLKGKGPADLIEISLALAGAMVGMGKDVYYEEGYQYAKKALESGEALEKFREFVKAQGGDLSFIEDEAKRECAPIRRDYYARESGYITKIVTEMIGVVASLLGAGRSTKESKIDPLAGVVLKKKVGDYVKKGEVIATFHTSTEKSLKNAERYFDKYIVIGDEKPEKQKLVHEMIG